MWWKRYCASNGFNNIEFGEKMHISVAQSDLKGEARYREKISSALSGRGFQEIINNSLTRPGYFGENGFDPKASVEMLNPLSRELSVMRQSLLFGGLESIARNANRQRPDLHLYEFGKVYQKSDAGYDESHKLGLRLSGAQQPESWKEKQQPTDFYYLKSEVENILQGLGFAEWDEKDSPQGIFDFALELSIKRKPVVKLGKIKPQVAKMADLKQEVFYAELDWDLLVKLARKNQIRFSELPRYPEVRRDLALLLKQEIEYADLKKSGGKNRAQAIAQCQLV
ncbi:MAG: hypothetical protein U5L96_18140 [Owenweeksia sp.]|nr:hypothetical protein [Owenweeksia sp.]